MQIYEGWPRAWQGPNLRSQLLPKHCWLATRRCRLPSTRDSRAINRCWSQTTTTRRLFSAARHLHCRNQCSSTQFDIVVRGIATYLSLPCCRRHYKMANFSPPNIPSFSNVASFSVSDVCPVTTAELLLLVQEPAESHAKCGGPCMGSDVSPRTLKGGARESTIKLTMSRTFAGCVAAGGANRSAAPGLLTGGKGVCTGILEQDALCLG